MQKLTLPRHSFSPPSAVPVEIETSKSILAPKPTHGIAADLLIGPYRQLAALIATLLLSVAIGLVIRRKLTRAYRLELDAMNNPARVSNGTLSTSIGRGRMV